MVLEMTGGNDGLNTVIPYVDDLYHKARPTLRHTKEAVIRLDDHVGLHPSMTGFRKLTVQPDDRRPAKGGLQQGR